KSTREGELKASDEGADRSALPDTGTPPGLELPPLQRTTLGNGLEVVLAERHEAPLVRANLVFDAGYAADQFATPGTANLALAMLDEGTESMDALAISGRLEDLGASIGTGSSLDTSFVTLATLKPTLARSLTLYADVVLHPSF